MVTIKNNASTILSSDVVLVVQGENIKYNKQTNIDIPNNKTDVTVKFTSRLRKTSVVPATGNKMTVSLSLFGKLLNSVALLVAAPMILYTAYMMLTRQATPLIVISGFGVLALIETVNLICIRNNHDLKFKWE